MPRNKATGRQPARNTSFKNGNPAYYEINVLRNDGEKLTKYELDPNSGTVKEKSDDKFGKFFTRLKPEAIQHAPTSLTRAIATAETRSGGKAQEAEVSRDGDQLLYKIHVVKLDGTTEKLEINGSDGKVAPRSNCLLKSSKIASPRQQAPLQWCLLPGWLVAPASQLAHEFGAQAVEQHVVATEQNNLQVICRAEQ